jgi:hypothetical protein
MTPRAEGQLLTATPAVMSIACSLAGNRCLAAGLLVLAVATAVVTVRRTDVDVRDERRARIGDT